MEIRGLPLSDVDALVRRVQGGNEGSSALLSQVVLRLASRSYRVMVAADPGGVAAARQALAEGSRSVVAVAEEAELVDLVMRATARPGAWSLILVGRADGAGVVIARRLQRRLRDRLRAGL
jgi:hypothetical protein